MTLDSLILMQDALECQRKGMTREQFVACVKESFRPVNAQAWDDSLALIAYLGTRRRAMDGVEREIKSARDSYFPA